MPYTTLASGLTLKVPTRGTRSWAQTFLDEFARKLSSHDHTGSPKGLQIGANAIAANAIDDSKMRLRNNQFLRGRNAANSADVDLIKINASNEIEFGATAALDGDALANGSVALTKLANIATDRLIGRDTASSGAPEELSVGGGIEFSGSGGIRRSALTGDVTASAGSNSTTIANDAITTSKILAANVTAPKLVQTLSINTWTPTLTFDASGATAGISYSARSAFWFRFGPLLVISININASTTTTFGMDTAFISIPSDIPLTTGNSLIHWAVSAHDIVNNVNQSNISGVSAVDMSGLKISAPVRDPDFATGAAQLDFSVLGVLAITA